MSELANKSLWQSVKNAARRKFKPRKEGKRPINVRT